MKAKRFSIRRVSRLADLDPSFFAKVLRGERQPPDDEKVLRRLAEALSLNPFQLILAVGRFPAEWKLRAEHPDVLKTLENLLGSGPASARASGRIFVPETLRSGERETVTISNRAPGQRAARVREKKPITANRGGPSFPAPSSTLSEDLL